MEPIEIKLSREDAMTLEVILDAHKRQASIASESGIVAFRVMKQIKKGLIDGN